jgi:hypothetical protein
MVRTLVLVACGAALAAPALAQARRQVTPPKPDPQVAARYQLASMEDALERAVQLGARLMSRQLQGAMPQLLLLGGDARARGFRLEGYGIFFDVDVPAMRQSVVWSYRMLDLTNAGPAGAIEALRDHLKTVRDPVQRRELDQLIRQLELQVAPSPGVAASVRGENSGGREGQATAVALSKPQPGAAPPSGGAPVVAQTPRIAVSEDDPNDAYTTAVRDALIDAMLGYSQSLSIGPDEWLTVAARDRGESGLSADDPFDVTTIQLRIKGADLLALHAGRLTVEEARKRVEVREY